MSGPVDLDGHVPDDLFDWHPVEDQVERGARVLDAENREWWGGQAQRIIAERAQMAQEREPEAEAEAAL